ncbi:MAG: glycoside hydrolase family 31 protein [TACK group archaeon]|nr:glycoside hydrolase family 31 protein [TACK group archaeon]
MNTYERLDNGIRLKSGTETTEITFLSEDIVKISRYTSRKAPELAVTLGEWNVKSSLTESDGIILSTGSLAVTVREDSIVFSAKQEFLREVHHEISDGASQIDYMASGDGFYGLGQHQGLFNYLGNEVVLSQRNPTETAVPLLVSSARYGILWDNASLSKLKLVEEAGYASIAYWAERGPVTYYVIRGNTVDDVVAGYRKLTGQVPLLPKWAYGYWQSKERYKNQAELLQIADQFKKEKIPLDVLVQDWMYWGKHGWNALRFDEDNYPSPSELASQLHDAGIRLMLSVWSNFGRSTEVYREFSQKGYLIPGSLNYDPFNEEARRAYWARLQELLKLGIDGWWLDASEPELNKPIDEASDLGIWSFYTGLHDSQTAMGPGANVVNAFPLMHTKAVYEGQRSVTDKRVVILTRSAFAGQQRHSAIIWSGDIHHDWGVLSGQIPAGLNFSVSGIPYWTTDTGGFFSGDPSTPSYKEIFIRWLQWSTFTPIMRVHGTWYAKEPWRFGEDGKQIIKSYIELRHRLFPYIYSVARMVTDGYTMMRPLFMDFDDRQVLNISDQYMFGPSIMVCPVTAPSTRRRVYLPKGNWYDFWTGKAIAGGSLIEVDSPLNKVPLFVKEGAIIPLGPADQSLSVPVSQLELRVYKGDNAEFFFYDDDGETYAYERGEFARVPFSWVERERKLKIGDQQGPFKRPNMKIDLVLVREGKGAGKDEGQPDWSTNYEGKQIEINL